MNLISRILSFRAILIAAVAVLVLGLLAASWITLERVVTLPSFKTWVEAEISGALMRPVTIEKIEWDRWPSTVLIGRNVRLWEDSSKQRFMLESPALMVDLSFSSIFRLALGLSEIRLVSPRIFFRQDESGEWNLSRLVKELDAASVGAGTAVVQVLFKRFAVKDGYLSLQNTRTLPELIPPLAIQGHGKLEFGGRFAFQVGCRMAESSSTVKLPLGIDETAAATITGLYVPSSTSTFVGVLQSSQTNITVKCAVTLSPRFTAAIDILDARYRTTSLKDLRASVQRDNEAYKIDITQFQVLGGTVDAHATYVPSVSTDSLRITWKTSGVQAQDIFNLAGSTLEVKGILDSEGHIESSVGGRFLSSMNGEIKLNLQKGWFGNASGLIKVLSKLNMVTLFSEAEGRTRVPFDETHGTLKIINGIASTQEPFVLENKTLQLAFMGTYELAKGRIDGEVAVHFLLITDEIINKIPLVNDILLGEKKGMIPVWVSVKGNIADPEVKMLSTKMIAGPAWNIIGNVFRLPKKLLQDVAGK